MNLYDHLRHKWMMYFAVFGLVCYAASALWLYQSRESLSQEVRSDALARCERASDADACHARVEQLHDDCYRWSLVRHDENPEVDRDKYADCLKHPPGKFRDSSN